jgi:predicted RND superfamily exporter protein
LFENIQLGLRALEQKHTRIRMHLTGTDFVARSNVNGMILDLAISLGFAALLIFGVIALEFRSLRLGLISLLPNLFPLALVGGYLYWSGRPLQMSSAILFTVLLGLAVDDTIHFLWRYRRERAQTGDVRLATTRAFFSVGRAIAITTLVLMLGFGCLVFSAIPLNQLFAGLACLGLVGALLGDLVFLPALLFLFDRQSKAD